MMDESDNITLGQAAGKSGSLETPLRGADCLDSDGDVGERPDFSTEVGVDTPAPISSSEYVTVRGVRLTHEEVVQRLHEAIAERTGLNNRIHLMKTEIDQAHRKYQTICSWLDVDPDDENGFRRALDDAKALKRFKSREAGGRLRSGEGISPNSLEHYEKKLADKRSRIRQLEMIVKLDRELVTAMSGYMEGCWPEVAGVGPLSDRLREIMGPHNLDRMATEVGPRS